MFHKHEGGRNKILACFFCINYVSRPKRVLSPSCLCFISIISNGLRFVTADLHLVPLDPLPPPKLFLSLETSSLKGAR